MNKRHLQKFYHLPVKDNIPLLGFTSRIAEQKGLDLIVEILPTLLLRDVQIIIMGDGDKEYINKINLQFEKSRLYYSRQLWTILVFQIWYKQYIENEKVSI